MAVEDCETPYSSYSESLYNCLTFPYHAAQKSVNLLHANTVDASIGQTPKTEIWRKNKTQLYRYDPVVPEGERKHTPVMLVFALMNDPAIFDLKPGSSFAEATLKQSKRSVYLYSPGGAYPEDKDIGFDDHALRYLPRAIRKVKEDSGSDSVLKVCWCQGAVYSTLHAAYYPSEGKDSTVLLTAPLSFENKQAEGFMSMIMDLGVDRPLIDRLVAANGPTVPGGMIDAGAKMLKTWESYVGNDAGLFFKADDKKVIESARIMKTWIRSLQEMSPKAYGQIIDLYREDKLVKGTWEVEGERGRQRINLGDVDDSLLFVISKKDHIVLPEQTLGAVPYFGSKDKTVVEIEEGGHIGLMVGKSASKLTWPKIWQWMDERAN